MNVRQLECFRAVMVTGMMTRAADFLSITQPSVSNLIANLEYEIGFELFKRSKGRLIPTPEAHYFYQDVGRTLGSIEQTAHTARQIRDRELGDLVIASYPGIGLDFLPRVISAFIADKPNVRIKLLSRSSEVVRELVPTQQFDLAIAELPADHPAVNTEPLDFSCVCALPAGHRLARKKVVKPKDLDGEPFISLFREHQTYFQVANAFASAGANWNLVAETQFFATACSFVNYGAGVAIVDPVTADKYKGQGLVVKPFEPMISYRIGMLYPLDRVRSRLLEALVSSLKVEIEPFTE
jgi:DNA-binding transcriptional LysR family regulator